MNYYFDTSVWIAYFDKNEFYHPEAVKWFEKIAEKGNMLYISIIIENEIKSKYPVLFSRYLELISSLKQQNKIRRIEIDEKERLEATKWNKRLKSGFNDTLQIILARNYNLLGVSIDKHFPKIAREIDHKINILFISQL